MPNLQRHMEIATVCVFAVGLVELGAQAIIVVAASKYCLQRWPTAVLLFTASLWVAGHTAAT